MHQHTLSPVVGDDQAAQLLEEIARLEHRLAEMGMDGDCAYERAMSRVYTAMVIERKRHLDALQRRPLA